MGKMKISDPQSWDEAVSDPKLDFLYAKMERAKTRFYALSRQIKKRERKTYAKSDKLLQQHLDRVDRARCLEHILIV